MLVIMVLVSLTIMMIDKDKISQCIYNSTMTIYYADDTIVTYDNAIAKVPLALMDD